MINVFVNIDNNSYKYELKLGSTINDLCNEINNTSLDYSNYSCKYCLSNNESIELKEVSNIDRISINDDNINNLIKLPGIGEKTAKKIIDFRCKYGDFETIYEIKDVSGIGDKKFEKIKEFISI